jgi:hypothetical protein
MGMVVTARCVGCEYAETLTLGAGMANHATFAAWPVHCRDCEAVSTANMKVTPVVCQACKGSQVTSYMDANLGYGEPSAPSQACQAQTARPWTQKLETISRALNSNDRPTRYVHTWGDLTLTESEYFCPKCRKFSLRFGPCEMIFD